MAYLFIKDHYTCIETMTPEQEEGEHESEAVGDDTPVENQGRHLCIFSPISTIFVHELLYVSVIA
jgi:hypothetical protein